MAKVWDEMPKMFISSAETRKGKEEILDYIEEINNQLQENFLPRQ